MLDGKEITLRAWCADDIGFFECIRNDIVLQEKLMTQPRPNSIERVKEWLISKSNKSDEIFFVVADAKSNQAVGYVQAVNIDCLHGRAEIGICLSPEKQRKGFGRKTIHCLEAYLQRTFGLRKLVLFVLEDNVYAVSFYLKYGFSEVGRLRKHFFLGGQFKDVVIMEKFVDL